MVIDVIVSVIPLSLVAEAQGYPRNPANVGLRGV